MKWFIGEVAESVQKAIKEKKVFMVFMRDENEDSIKMEEVWNDDDIANVCTEEMCVAINVLSESVPGKQFAAIYPVLQVPSTYIINNQGSPVDIIPGVLTTEEFKKRLQHGIQAALTQLTQPPSLINEDKPGFNNNDQLPATAEEGRLLSNEDNQSNAAVGGEPPFASSCVAHNSAVTGDKEMTSTEETKEVRDELTDNSEGELTSSEKAMMSMLHEKLKTKKEDEHQRKKEMEKKRREMGREMQDAQRKIAEMQAKHLAEEIANRKSEERAAREKIREQIRLDRIEKNKLFDKEKNEREELRKKAESCKSTEKKKIEKKKIDSNTSRLQFRLPDGSSISNEFNADAAFLVADSFVKEHIHSSNIRLTTVYPKHEFNGGDMLLSFRDLGLVPNASIIVSPGPSQVSSASSSNPLAFFNYIFAIIFGFMKWLGSLFSGNSTNATETTPATSQSTQPSVNQPRNDDVRRRNLQTGSSRSSNMQRLWRDEDDDNATWNGNSTQQM